MYGRRYGGGYRRRTGGLSRILYPKSTTKKLLRVAKNAVKMERKYPTKDYGRVYLPRGTPWGTQQFGYSAATATPDQRQRRQMAGYTGRGGYWGRLIGRGIGSLVGAGDWGAKAGDAAGDWLDDKARSFAEARGFSGAGAYNSLINPTADDTTVPRMQSSSDETGALTIRHREYITDVTGSSTFQNTAYLVNPTNPSLFPFLSQFACNFDEYEFKQIIIHYKSVTTDLSTSSQQLGTVIMVADYNAGSSDLFTNKVSMMQYDGAVSSRVCDNITFGIECDPSKNAMGGILYTPPYGQTPPGEDPKTYNLALFQIACNQTVATGQVGELWVDYTITLRKPKFCSALGLNLPYLALQYVNTTPSLPLGVPANVCDVSQTRVVNLHQLAQLETNLNNSTLYALGPVTTLNQQRVVLQNTCGSTNVWSVYAPAVTASATGIVVTLPDTLGQGTYEYQLILQMTGGSVATLVPSATPNINILSSSVLTSAVGAAAFLTVSTVNALFTVNSSAINIGIGGTNNTGSYIGVAVTYGSVPALTAKTYIRIRQINPAEISV